MTENPSLTELSLDGNPLASNPEYHKIIIHRMKNLKVLDTRPLMEEERIRVAREIEEEVEELLRAEEEARVHIDYCMAVIIDTIGASVASH